MGTPSGPWQPMSPVTHPVGDPAPDGRRDGLPFGDRPPTAEELRERFERPCSRRRLDADEADSLIRAWKRSRRTAEPIVEPLWAYLGWTPQELGRFERTRICPVD